ncbi:MAG: hypothetical protein H6834_11895 [Planctomycetes bacterium]|nr:hypothetical protein [Planctomycetota bacterium]
MKITHLVVVCSPFLFACSQTQEVDEPNTIQQQGAIQKEMVSQADQSTSAQSTFQDQQESSPSPSAGMRAESSEAFTQPYPKTEVVHQVSTSEELRQALQNLAPHTDIVLAAGTYQVDGPTVLPSEVMEQVRIVGQGMDQTHITMYGNVPVLEWTDQEQSPMKFVFQEVTVYAEGAPFVSMSGMGVIEINRASLEGKRVVDAPSCVARWRSQAEVPTMTPAVRVKSLQRIMGASHKKNEAK